MRLRVGATGIDISFARPPAARVRELGFEFLVGYISIPPASPKKNLTKIERDVYEAAGLDVPLVYEMSASRANLGATYGAIDGAAAKTLAAQRDYPIWYPILIADDTNTTGGILGALAAIGRAIRGVFSSGNIDAQEAYMRAFAAACAPYPVGIYGDIDILTRCRDLWVLGWLPNAWAWSGTSRKNAEDKARALGVHVLQRKGFYIDNTWAVDPNEVIKDVTFGPTSTGSTEHFTIGDDDMLRLLAPTDSPARFYAFCDPQGRALRCEWTGDGNDPAVQGRIAFYENATPAGTQFDMPLSVGNLINVSLDGPLPPGFSAEQFGNPAEIKARSTSPATQDVEARSRITTVEAALAEVTAETDHILTVLRTV